MKKPVLSCAFGCALALAALPVKADTITYVLDTGNSDISGFTGPYGSVLVNLTTPTTATITFTADSVAGKQYLFADGGTAGVNVNAGSWTIGLFNGANSGTGFTPGPWSDGGAGNEDGFGSFNQTVDSFDGYTHSSDTLSFILTDTSGTWPSAGSVLTPNASGYLVAAHIFVGAVTPPDASTDALATGFAAGDSPVPDGGVTVALLGLAILGIESVRRRLSKA